MTYSINALIEYDYEELNKYGLSIQNVSIECSEYGSFFSITGDLIITDSKKADKSTSYYIICTVYVKGKEFNTKHIMVATYKERKKTFTTPFFIPFDVVDKIRLSVKSRNSIGGNMEFSDMEFELEWMAMQHEHEMDMMDPWDFL